MSYMIIGRGQHHYQNPSTVVNFTIDEMKPQIVKTYQNWFLTKALAPYDYAKEHYVLWPIDSAVVLQELSSDAKLELFEILQSWYDENFTITRNSPEFVTVLKKLHFHIIKLNVVRAIDKVEFKDQ